MKEIRWGMIGCGDVTEVKSGPAFNKARGSRLVAVMRRDEEKVKDYAERHGVPKWYTDAEELINDEEVDAVYIATPPSSHALYTIMAANAGKPVYVEKPMAMTLSQCGEMVNVCKDADVPLFVAYYRRMLPSFLKVKEIVESGTIGEVRGVNIRLYWAPKPEDIKGDPNNWRVKKSISGGGYFHDLASHQFDFLDYVLGPIANAGGINHNQAGFYNAPDITTAAFNFESGVVGSGIWCFTADKSSQIDMTEIIGSKGTVKFPSFDLSKPVMLTSSSGNEGFRFDNPEHIQQPLIQSIVDELNGGAPCPSKGESAMRTSNVLDLITA
ncbi:Gfo/Idh/MocA family oxidoreductase [Flammeovirgaceae bacterium SG7u.111]|nr:Gfo/Idh/MocA family oxidoreductase [Flammeovirgaceae bacterium SG7u.132]WPO33017.1 Gfo/Idh/MocA family oxidoreductase [Flammeovirgaceae bacterium SG7u.111]